jgi:hypothetical protein
MALEYYQMTFLDSDNKIIDNSPSIDFKNYNLEKYLQNIEILGIETTWNNICNYLLQNHNINAFLNINNLCELYEIGLSAENKESKKRTDSILHRMMLQKL